MVKDPLEILNEAVLMKKMVETMHQRFIDFLPETLVELHRYVLHHFNFHRLHFTFPETLVLTNLHCVKRT
jgi:hypothetical protein